MNNSNTAIARRVNKELRIRGWGQTELLKGIIKYKNPEISKEALRSEVLKRKGNFSTTMKGNKKRSFSKEELYIISKIFGVPLEYIWFGDEKKSGFVPNGARYAAYQDSDSEYRSYIAGLEYEDKAQYPDEFGFNLFDYFGQFDSINGYKFFEKNFGLCFDYIQFGELTYVNGEGYLQLCSSHNKDYLVSDNLIMVLVEHNDVRTFKKVYFDNCSLGRFNPEMVTYRNKRLFSDYFLETLLNNEAFFELILKISEIDISSFNKNYAKGSKRRFVEPMLYEALYFALQHQDNFKQQLYKMLNVALEYSKSQYEFVKEYLESRGDKWEHGDVHIDQYSPRFIRSSRNIPMGNVFNIKEKASDESLNDLIRLIEQCTFNITHIIKGQEKTDDEIMISTPNNPLFKELSNNSIEQRADFVPIVTHANNEFTYFKSFESAPVNYENVEDLKLIVECLDKAQKLVTQTPNKVLVHGNMNGKILMMENGKAFGLSGWQDCHYGTKFEDRAELLANIDIYSVFDHYLQKYEILFNVISQGFNQEEKVKLIDNAIKILNERRKIAIKEDDNSLSRICSLKERVSRLELFKELYL